MGHIIELFSHEDPFVARIRRWFRKPRVVNVIRRTPRTIRPMRASLQNIVLKILFVEQHKAASVANVRKFFEPVPIPRIVFRKVVQAQSVPRSPLPCPGKWHFVERRPNITVYAPNALVVVATTLVPQSVMMV